MRNTALKLGLRVLGLMAAILLRIGGAPTEEIEELKHIRTSVNVTDLEAGNE